MTHRYGMGLMLGLLVAAVGALCGCQGPGLGGTEEKKFPADYKGLNDKTVAIVVYVDSATNFEYPSAREEISNFVTQQIQTTMPKTRLVPYDMVIRWQNETINWQALTGSDIAQHFNVDCVLMIDVLDYATREPDMKNLVRGRLRALAQVYEKGQGSPAWQKEVGATWPAKAPLEVTRSSDLTARMRVLESFAISLVNNFHDSETKLTSDTTPKQGPF